MPIESSEWHCSSTTLSLTTFNIMSLSIYGLYVTLSISDNQHTRHSAQQCSTIILSVIILNVVIISVSALSVIAPSLIVSDIDTEHLYWVSFILSVIYTECHSYWVSLILSVTYTECHLNWVSLILSVTYTECQLYWAGMSEIRDRAQAAPVKSRKFRDNGLPVSG